MDLEFVSSVHLSSDKLQEYLKVMEEGNKLLKKWANQLYGKRKRRTFREKFFSGEIIQGKDIPIYDYGCIMAIKTVQQGMLEGFSRLLTESAKRWAQKYANGNGIDAENAWMEIFPDLHQEANLAFLDALYGYLGECKGASFFTYTWRVVDRRLHRYVNNEKMRCVPQTGDGARKILRAFQTFKQTCGRYITFDEYVIENNLTEEQRLILIRALAYTVTESDFMCSHPVNSESLQESDFTAFNIFDRTGVAPDEQLENKELIENLQKCIDLANLTSFQLELISSPQYHGWKADLARKYNVSRTRAGQAYNEAVEKVKEIYKQLQGDE